MPFRPNNPTANHPSQDIEFCSPAEIKAFQEELLRKQLRYLQAHSPFYQQRFAKCAIDIADIRTIEDLQKLPFTTKEDLLHYNREICCVPPEQIIDYITTSGTLGDPVTFVCNETDLERLAWNEAKSFACAGIGSNNIVQLTTTLDKRFMAGLAYFLGLRKLGAGVVRVGNGNPELQWDTIQRIKPDTIMCVPSFVLRLMDYAQAQNIDYRASSLKRLIGVGEGLRNQDFALNLLGARIHERWPELELFATYSSTEMSATFSECSYGCGGHVHPELIIVEIIGEDNQPLTNGEPGEVVATTLGVEAMPLLRFRTGDIAAMHTELCACGRWSYRLSPLVGRKHNMIKLKGTTLYPPAIYDVLDNAPYIENYVMIVRSTETGTDEVTVKIGLKTLGTEEYRRDVLLKLTNSFRARLRVLPIIEICPTDTIRAINFPHENRKPVKFIDERHL